MIAPLAQSQSGASGALADLRVHGVAARLAQSLYGLSFYLWKTILPTDLSPSMRSRVIWILLPGLFYGLFY